MSPSYIHGFFRMAQNKVEGVCGELLFHVVDQIKPIECNDNGFSVTRMDLKFAYCCNITSKGHFEAVDVVCVATKRYWY